jgi:hypothetical protein
MRYGINGILVSLCISGETLCWNFVLKFCAKTLCLKLCAETLCWNFGETLRRPREFLQILMEDVLELRGIKLSILYLPIIEINNACLSFSFTVWGENVLAKIDHIDIIYDRLTKSCLYILIIKPYRFIYKIQFSNEAEIYTVNWMHACPRRPCRPWTNLQLKILQRLVVLLPTWLSYVCKVMARNPFFEVFEDLLTPFDFFI